GLVGAAGAALPPGLEHRGERRRAPRAAGGDGERDRAPLWRVAHGVAQLQRLDDGVAAESGRPDQDPPKTIKASRKDVAERRHGKTSRKYVTERRKERRRASDPTPLCNVSP